MNLFNWQTLDIQSKALSKTDDVPAVIVTDNEKWVLKKNSNDDKWYLDTSVNSATIDFAATKDDFPCNEGGTAEGNDLSIDFTCNGAGYMYCTPWELNVNEAFNVQ